MKFITTADIHLGAGPDLGRERGDRLRDQAATLGCIAELANDHRVNAVLVAGDVFDGPMISPDQETVFADFIVTCRDYRIPVVVTLGNGKHDLAMRDESALSIFHHVAGISVHTRPDVRLVGDTAVCCLPWAPVSRLVAQRDGGDRDEVHEDAAALVLRIARGLREDATALGAQRAILMLHWSISGAALPNGLPVDQLREPVIPLEELEALGFDAVVAGHIHRRQLLSPGPLVESGNGSHVVAVPCPVFYCGSPLPLNWGETNVDHGCWLLEFDETGSRTPTFLPIESRPFVTLDFDHEDPVAQIALSMDIGWDVDDAIVRVRYRATEEQARRVDHPALIRSLYDAGAHKVFVQPEIVRAQRARVDGVDESLAPMTALDLWLEAEHAPEPQRHSLRALTNAYLEAVGT